MHSKPSPSPDIDEDYLHSKTKRSHMQQRPSVRSISELPNIIGIHTHQKNSDICTYLLMGLTWSLIIACFPFSIFFIFRVIQEYERGWLC